MQKLQSNQIDCRKQFKNRKGKKLKKIVMSLAVTRFFPEAVSQRVVAQF